MLELPPLSLYVHFPWCIRKCPYCDFNSHQVSGAIPQSSYVQALLADLDLDLPYVQDRPLHAIFIGGGTPSLMDPEALSLLLAGVQQRLPWETPPEITLEANPGTVEAGRFAAFRQSGVNRLSLGIQSFDDDMLARLGRIHDGDQARTAIETARAAGFDNFNLDLMYGLPEQTTEQSRRDLEQALSFAPEHLSWYQLTIEPNTGFFSRPPVLPPEDVLADIQEQGLSRLAEAGLERYEISAYGRPGRQAQHNLNYWRFGDYLGIGAGAHGKLTLPQDDRIVRTRKLRQPDSYLRADLSYTAEHKVVQRGELTLEFMLNALRLTQGFDTATYEARTGLAFRDIGKQIECLRDQGLLSVIQTRPEDSSQRIVPTSKGLLFTNNLLEEFL